MNDRDERKLWERVGVEYNTPLVTPREEMWKAIEGRLGSAAASEPAGGPDRPVLDLTAARERRGATAPGSRSSGVRPMLGWAVAAAALLVLGVGIGRMSVAPTTVADRDAPPGGSEVAPAVGGNGLAARAHLGRSEALLTMVRADARDGRVDPAVAVWAEDLLAQTRLLLDRPQGVDAGLQDLLLDLELVLVQVVGLAETDSDDAQARTEVELTLRTLDEGEVLPRIQAQIPRSMAGA